MPDQNSETIHIAASFQGHSNVEVRRLSLLSRESIGWHLPLPLICNQILRKINQGRPESEENIVFFSHVTGAWVSLQAPSGAWGWQQAQEHTWLHCCCYSVTTQEVFFPPSGCPSKTRCILNTAGVLYARKYGMPLTQTVEKYSVTKLDAMDSKIDLVNCCPDRLDIKSRRAKGKVQLIEDHLLLRQSTKLLENPF